MNKKTKNIYKRVSTIIVGIVMILSIIAFLSIALQVVGGKKPSIFGYRLYYILTDSMTPELQVNDVIISETINSAEEAKSTIKKGDVVTFVAEYGIQKGLTITHKVVETPYFDQEKNREVILTRGVKEGAITDPPVPIENVQAIMVKNVAFLGKIYRFVMSGVGLIALIVLPMLIMIAVLVIRLIITIKRPVKKELTKEEIAKKAVDDYIAKKQLEEEIKKKAIEEYIKKNEQTEK